MTSCYTVSDNITKSLMKTTNFLWVYCTKNDIGVFFDWMNARIFLWPFFIKLATIRSRPFKFSSATIVLFILLFFGLLFSLYFYFFLLLNLFGGGTCVTSVFFSVLFLDGILAKKFVMLYFLCISWASFGFTGMNRSGIKRTKWFNCQSFSKSVFVVCGHNIDAVFSVFTRGETVTLSHFVWQWGFFIWDQQILCCQKTKLANAYIWWKQLHISSLMESNIAFSKLSTPYFKISSASYKDLFLTISPTTLIRNSFKSSGCSPVSNF